MDKRAQKHPTAHHPNRDADHFDVIIVGSGFGGSVSAHRLVQKGYRVLMLEKGRRLTASDFPKTNWDLRRWFWAPILGWRGLFSMRFFRHITVFSGVGVGGGSLVYANTLPIPNDDFFAAPSWAHLARWKHELSEHYHTARSMLGAAVNPYQTYPDKILAEVARDLGKAQSHQSTTVAVYFGEPGKTVADPYFGGEGPTRTGCIQCGGCMLGCRFHAKNTLDKNYLYFAEKHGLVLQPDSEVTWVRPIPHQTHPTCYEVTAQYGASILPWKRHTRRYKANKVIFAGGVLGTVDLLLKLKGHQDGLPHLSPQLGAFVRTNSESLIGVISHKPDVDMSKGIAITSILHTDPHSHLEPVRYPRGSGFFRIMGMPHVGPGTFWQRMWGLLTYTCRHPWRVFKSYTVSDFAKQTMILLYMRTLDGHLRFTRRRRWWHLFCPKLASAVTAGEPPQAAIPEATDLARRIATKVDGEPMSILNETLLNIPSTAHILGGCCMGDSAATGVIDAQHRVHGYDGLYVIDGSAISANPGVNPSLTICALAERAMTFIPAAQQHIPVSECTQPNAAPSPMP